MECIEKLIQQTIPVRAEHSWHEEGLARGHARNKRKGEPNGAKKNKVQPTRSRLSTSNRSAESFGKAEALEVAAKSINEKKNAKRSMVLVSFNRVGNNNLLKTKF